MRSEAQYLQHAADCTLLDQLAGEDGAFHVEALAVVHHVFLTRGGGAFAGAGELFERRERAFVGEVILT